MSIYSEMTRDRLMDELEKLRAEYAQFKARELSLDMSRGKPGAEQLDLSMDMLTIIKDAKDCLTESGTDYRNYGLLNGIPEARKLFADIMDVNPENVTVGGNSSLNMMYDTISAAMTHGLRGYTPWCQQEKLRFLCPVPGYDRHFTVTGHFGFEMLPVPMTPDGPDMDIIEELVKDAHVKGIWCVPKYSNPQGCTYSDETVRRFAALKPAAPDFLIMWDNAYIIHDLGNETDPLLNIMSECEKVGNENHVVMFTSTSKITFPGSGVAAMAASSENMAWFRKRCFCQTIGPDKLNQLRHIRFLRDINGVKAHMDKHKAILRPKFDVVANMLHDNLDELDIISWKKPNGGYFISVDTLPGCASRVVELCKQAGVTLTPAGATFPYGIDPDDRNIRLAPTYPPVSELEMAMQLFCICVKLAAVEHLLNV